MFAKTAGGASSDCITANMVTRIIRIPDPAETVRHARHVGNVFFQRENFGRGGGIAHFTGFSQVGRFQRSRHTPCAATCGRHTECACYHFIPAVPPARLEARCRDHFQTIDGRLVPEFAEPGGAVTAQRPSPIVRQEDTKP